MSDRMIATVVSPLLLAGRPGRAVHGLARSVVTEPRGAWSALPEVRPAPGPAERDRVGIWATLRAAWRRQRTRQCLAELDAHTLKDIGITYAEAEAEANKPFWVM